MKRQIDKKEWFKRDGKIEKTTHGQKDWDKMTDGHKVEWTKATQTENSGIKS